MPIKVCSLSPEMRHRKASCMNPRVYQGVCTLMWTERIIETRDVQWTGCHACMYQEPNWCMQGTIWCMLLKVALHWKQEVVNIIHTLCNYPFFFTVLLVTEFLWMVHNHLAIYFHFTEFESCSLNSTRGTDEAHCRALGTLCRTTA